MRKLYYIDQKNHLHTFDSAAAAANSIALEPTALLEPAEMADFELGSDDDDYYIRERDKDLKAPFEVFSV